MVNRIIITFLFIGVILNIYYFTNRKFKLKKYRENNLMIKTIGHSEGKGFSYGKQSKCIKVVYKDEFGSMYSTKYCGIDIILGKAYNNYYFELEYYINDPSFVILDRDYKIN